MGGAHHSRGAHCRQRGQEEGDEYEAAERPRHDPHARPSDRLRGAEALRPRARRLCCCQKPTGEEDALLRSRGFRLTDYAVAQTRPLPPLDIWESFSGGGAGTALGIAHTP